MLGEESRVVDMAPPINNTLVAGETTEQVKIQLEKLAE